MVLICKIIQLLELSIYMDKTVVFYLGLSLHCKIRKVYLTITLKLKTNLELGTSYCVSLSLLSRSSAALTVIGIGAQSNMKLISHNNIEERNWQRIRKDKSRFAVFFYEFIMYF